VGRQGTVRRVTHQVIIVLDFGSQYTQLIARRLRELSVYSEVLPHSTPTSDILARAPSGIILSGGPRSVLESDAPLCEAALLTSGVPVLGVCYGMQLMTRLLGGHVELAERREFGPAEIEQRAGDPAGRLFEGLPRRQRVWASHGDAIVSAPAGFDVVATSANAPIAAIEDRARRLFGLLFHPEVAHTEHGVDMLRRFAFGECGCSGDWDLKAFVHEAVARVRDIVGDRRVICALSGGVDSAVAALIIHRAIGERLTCVFVDNGVLRQDEGDQVRRRLAGKFQLPVVFVDASTRFLSQLAGVTDPERKRKIIGALFVDVFEEQAQALGGFEFLAQGTLYPDVIESVSVVGPSAAIKSHHNVGGLPARMRMRLVEPLRQLFKDEVRMLGRELGLDDEFVRRQPFPGPGLAVRIIGEITPERLDLVRRADTIVIEEVRRYGLYERLWQSFAVLLPVRSVGVMGDERTYDCAVAVRAVESRDGMTADWARLPHDLLATISTRIVNEVRGVNRVVYDISSKPPSTIEWE
jgi:GMP synthase (glutamine-hydrolysing)